MPIAETTKQTIISLYESNISIRKIRDQTGVSEPTISKILKAAGIEIRRHNYQKLQLDAAEINRLYDGGMSTYEIAARLGCSDETIRALVVTVRDPATRNRLDAESVRKIAVASRLNWADAGYRSKVAAATSTPEYRQRLREAGIVNYASGLGRWVKTAEAKLTISAAVKRLWQNEEYRAAQVVWFAQRCEIITKASVAALKDPEKRAAWIRKLREWSATNRRPDGWVSTSQKQLYYILQTSGIEFHEEGPDTRIGPFYVVDCVIPKQQAMARSLIVEVQGEYWHGLPHVMAKDRQKATYVRKHTDYDLLALDELRLNSFGEVEAKLAGYGLTLSSQTCKPADLTVKRISEADASLFYSIFHYTGTVRKGAVAFGAYLMTN
jgi:DNA-binding CsgD family transcriptional regulator